MCATGTKVGQGHPNDRVCNHSVTSINLPNMNAARKFLYRPDRRDN